jgi:hypothetical protein
MTIKLLANGFYADCTTSRRMGGKTVKARSQTPGKDKGGSCVKNDLKTWGIRANPYKMRGGDLEKYDRYCAMTNGLNK